MTKEQQAENDADQKKFENECPTYPVIQRLLNASFRELQHDTGPSDPEFRHSWRLLEKEFKKILKNYL